MVFQPLQGVANVLVLADESLNKEAGVASTL